MHKRDDPLNQFVEPLMSLRSDYEKKTKATEKNRPVSFYKVATKKFVTKIGEKSQSTEAFALDCKTFTLVFSPCVTQKI